MERKYYQDIGIENVPEEKIHDYEQLMAIDQCLQEIVIQASKI